MKTEAQFAVYNEAKRRLKEEPWFHGVCMDEFPLDSACRDHFEDAIESVVAATMFWDAL